MVNPITERVITTDPRRWPVTPPDAQSILQRIHGYPDDYAIDTYGTKIARTILAKESRRFIGNHIGSERLIISRALQESSPCTRSIVDLGSRDGRLYSELIKPGELRGIQFKNYFGIDLDSKVVDFLRKRLAYDPTAHAVLGDITALDQVLRNIEDEFGRSVIESPVVCMLQNTLGTIIGKGGWADVVMQLKKMLANYPKTEIVLSLYKAVNPNLTVEEIIQAIKTIEEFNNRKSKEASSKLTKTTQLLGNGWLVPSYLYTITHNGWPPDAAKLKEKLLFIPESGYLSRQWNEDDIKNIGEQLGVKETERQEGEEFVVLRLKKN